MPFVFSATTTLVVPDRFFFLLTNIVKKPFAYPKIRVCKDTKCCLSINYKIDIFEWRSQVIAQLLCIGRPPLGQAGKWGAGCSAVRCPVQRAASFIAACCAGTCSALHFTSHNGTGCQRAQPKANGRAAFEQNQSCPCMKERSFSGKRKCVFPQKKRAAPNAQPLFLIQNSAFTIIAQPNS